MKLAKWEWLALLGIVLVGAWLRFAHLDLVEFKGDEAVAAHLALQFVKGGVLPTAGLMSSVGVTNPPLFIYLLIPMFFITTNVIAVSAMIAGLGLAAVVMTWWVGRKYYGAWAGLVAAAMFATGPWAVIYSRKIWAQDFVPVLVTPLVWALHALVLGKKPKAIFWVVLLPLAVIQIHFSGLALTAMVVVLLAVLRPKLDWRWAVAGLVAATVVMVPYLRMQAQNDWRDFQQAKAQLGGKKWDAIPRGMTIQPQSGYPLPRRPSEAWIHALSIMNSGQIEDVVGLDKDAFVAATTLGEVPQVLQRLLVLAGVVWLIVVIIREKLRAQREIVLVGWLTVPVLVFMLAGLWTYLSYYAILLPGFFLVAGAVVERCPAAKRKFLVALAGVLCLGSAVYLTDFYRFVASKGGAHGTYGTGVGYKLRAADWLAQVAGANELYAQERLLQMDQLGRLELAQMDLPFLVAWREHMPTRNLATNQFVLVYDANRANYDPERVPQLAGVPHETFGPMRLYLLSR